MNTHLLRKYTYETKYKGGVIVSTYKDIVNYCLTNAFELDTRKTIAVFALSSNNEIIGVMSTKSMTHETVHYSMMNIGKFLMDTLATNMMVVLSKPEGKYELDSTDLRLKGKLQELSKLLKVSLLDMIYIYDDEALITFESDIWLEHEDY